MHTLAAFLAITSSGIAFALLKFIGVPMLSYLWRKKEYRHIPQCTSNYNVPYINSFVNTALLEQFVDFVRDKEGKLLPFAHFGPNMDGTHVVAATHPDVIKEILSNEETFQKHPMIYVGLKKLLGDGLVTSSGLFWKSQRRLLTGLFHFNALKDMFPLLIDSCNTYMEILKGYEGKEILVRDHWNEMSLSAIIKVGFGDDFDTNWMMKEWRSITNEMMDYLTGYGIFGQYFDYFPVAAVRNYYKSLQRIKDKVQEAIKKRRESGYQRQDMLNFMMEAKDSENGEGMSDSLLIDHSLTFMLAGQDTTATLLSWTTYFLGKYPEIQEKLRNEVDNVLENQNPTPETLSKLKYTKQVLEETLRFKAPVQEMERYVTKDVELMGTKIPKGTTILAFIQAPQVSEEYFEDPLTFNPDRFSEENRSNNKKHPWSFIPFSGGPRNCIGQKLAMQEAMIALSMLVQRFEIVVDQNQKFTSKSNVTLEPIFKARFIPRESPSNGNL